MLRNCSATARVATSDGSSLSSPTEGGFDGISLDPWKQAGLSPSTLALLMEKMSTNRLSAQLIPRPLVWCREPRPCSGNNNTRRPVLDVVVTLVRVNDESSASSPANRPGIAICQYLPHFLRHATGRRKWAIRLVGPLWPTQKKKTSPAHSTWHPDFLKVWLVFPFSERGTISWPTSLLVVSSVVGTMATLILDQLPRRSPGNPFYQ